MSINRALGHPEAKPQGRKIGNFFNFCFLCFLRSLSYIQVRKRPQLLPNDILDPKQTRSELY